MERQGAPNGLSKHDSLSGVMAGLVPAIHDLPHGNKNVVARDKPGHDEGSLTDSAASAPAGALASAWPAAGPGQA